jgi:hypothetical protein
MEVRATGRGRTMDATGPSAEIGAILERVASWPPADRLALAQGVLETLGRDLGPPRLPRPNGTIADLVGLLKTDAPPPTDEEVAQMLHDERMRRYGS